jgi:hypothetical protein
VRQVLEPGRGSVVERFNIEVAVIHRELDSDRLVVLRLAAHADFSGKHLGRRSTGACE